MAILVIEDEFLVAADIGLHLTRGGFSGIEHVSTEADALAAIAGGNWAAAIVDANLDGKGVEAVVAALKGKAVPFVVVTGYGHAGLPAAVAGAPVIGKPFDPRTLLETVVRLSKKSPV